MNWHSGMWGIQVLLEEAVWEAELHWGSGGAEGVDEHDPRETQGAPGAHWQGHDRLWAHWGVLLQSLHGRLQPQVRNLITWHDKYLQHAMLFNQHFPPPPILTEMPLRKYPVHYWLAAIVLQEVHCACLEITELSMPHLEICANWAKKTCQFFFFIVGKEST